MVADMIKNVLSAEAEGKSFEAQAQKKADKIISKLSLIILYICQ